MPNPSDEIRILLTLNYYAGYVWLKDMLLGCAEAFRWFKNGALVPFPVSLKPHVAAMENSAGIKIAAEWIPDEEYDYLSSKFSNNFSSVLRPEVWAKIAHVKTAKGY